MSKVLEMMDKRIISSFCGLKVLALSAIFYWHSMLPHRNPLGDWGLHATQFFFVVSGFLVANRYWGDWCGGKCTVSGLFAYCWKKLRVIWPLHIALLVCLFAWKASSQYYTGCDFVQLVVSGLFLQAWTGPLFALNGPAWFISALLFCYFVSPLLIGIIYRDSMAFKMFLAVIAIRYGIEWVQISYPNQFWAVNCHGNPILRCLEFYTGILMYPPYRTMRNHIRDGLPLRLLFTILELSALSVLLAVVIPNVFHQIRGSIVLWYCLFVFIFAFDYGYVSRFLGTKPFRLLATIELAFFLFHIPVRNFLQPVFAWLSWGALGSFALWLTVTLVLAFAWQAVVMHAYKMPRLVYWAASVVLIGGLLCAMFCSTHSFVNRIELVFSKSSESFLDKTERIIVFYSTVEKPEIWKQPILNLSVLPGGRHAFRWPTPEGMRQFRIEFKPKKGCTLCRRWPKVERLIMGGQDYPLEKLSPYYFGDRSGFDGKVLVGCE